MHCLVWQMAGSVGMYLLGLQLACGFAFNRSLSLFTGHLLAQCCLCLLGFIFFLPGQLCFAFLFAFICSVCICHPWVALVFSVHASCLSMRFTYSDYTGFPDWHIDCSVALVLLSLTDCLLC